MSPKDAAKEIWTAAAMQEKKGGKKSKQQQLLEAGGEEGSEATLSHDLVTLHWIAPDMRILLWGNNAGFVWVQQQLWQWQQQQAALCVACSTWLHIIKKYLRFTFRKDNDKLDKETETDDKRKSAAKH